MKEKNEEKKNAFQESCWICMLSFPSSRANAACLKNSGLFFLFWVFALFCFDWSGFCVCFVVVVVWFCWLFVCFFPIVKIQVCQYWQHIQECRSEIVLGKTSRVECGSHTWIDHFVFPFHSEKKIPNVFCLFVFLHVYCFSLSNF